jgi:hypothetical protein
MTQRDKNSQGPFLAANALQISDDSFLLRIPGQ